MDNPSILRLLKPGLSLLLAATLALGQQAPVREQSAVWGAFAPEDLAKLSSEIGRPAKGDPIAAEEIDVIVQYREAPEQQVERAIRKGAKVKGVLSNALVARMTRQAAAELASDPNVVYISPDREVSASTNEIDYSTATVNADKALKSGFDGRGIGIAFIDSGVSADNEDTFDSTCVKGAGRIVYTENFVPWDPNSWDPYGHGSHVSSIATGNGCVAKSPATAPMTRPPASLPPPESSTSAPSTKTAKGEIAP